MNETNPIDTRTSGQKFRDTLQLKGTGEVPAQIGFSLATRIQYGDALLDVLERHPRLPIWRPARGTDFRGQLTGAYQTGRTYTDNWGCVWKCIRDGMEGQIIKHPLADLRNLRNYKAPDPLVYSERARRDWEEFTRKCRETRAMSDAVTIGGERFFERVHFLRGMEDTLADMAQEAPEIQGIIDLVLEYNLGYLRHALQLGAPADIVGFGDDWGCQDRCMISAGMFRRYFKPGYAKMYALCKQYGALTTQHSDGYTVDLWDEFLEAGLTAFNMQVNCIGVDTIEKRLKGRMCLIADVDRQGVLPFGKPEQVRNHIAEIVTRLGSPKGGLILRIDIYPDVPLQNIEALLSAVEEYRHYWYGKS